MVPKKSEEHEKLNAMELILISVIVILPIIIFYFTINYAPVQWDISVRALQGKTLLNFLTHHASIKAAFSGEYSSQSNNLLFYFVADREPLPIPIFALLYVFFRYPILPYILVAYAVYLFGIWKLGGALKVNKLIMYAVMINTYTIYFLFIPNGGEGLAIGLALVGLAYLIEQKAESGIFFGLASLAKYPTLILFPLVFFIKDKKRRNYALLFELAAVIIWGFAIDYPLYGLPLFSYLQSSSAAGGVAFAASPIAIAALVMVLGYPFIFATLGLVTISLKDYKVKLHFDARTRILASFAILALVLYAIALPHFDAFTQARYGFLAATGLLICAAAIAETARKANPSFKYLAAGFTVVVIAITVFNTMASVAPTRPYFNAYGSYNNPNPGNTVYAQGARALNASGFNGYGPNGCRFVSNAWIPMIYLGYNAYSPLVLYYGNNTLNSISPILSSFGPGFREFVSNISIKSATSVEGAYLSQYSRYPILYFKSVGVARSFIANLNGSSVAYNNSNFSIYLPKNAACFHNAPPAN